MRVAVLTAMSRTTTVMKDDNDIRDEMVVTVVVLTEATPTMTMTWKIVMTMTRGELIVVVVVMVVVAATTRTATLMATVTATAMAKVLATAMAMMCVYRRSGSKNHRLAPVHCHEPCLAPLTHSMRSSPAVSPHTHKCS